jgi:hypothetical protein
MEQVSIAAAVPTRLTESKNAFRKINRTDKPIAVARTALHKVYKCRQIYGLYPEHTVI